MALPSGSDSFIGFLPALVSESCLRRELLLKELPVEDGQIQRGLDTSVVARFSEAAEHAVLTKAGRTE